MGNNDAEIAQTAQWGNFSDQQGLSDKTIRMKFIRKVYLIVSAQLVFTFGICSIFVLVEPVKQFARSDLGFYFYIASYVIYIALTIIFAFLSCTKGLRRYPYNYFILFAFTVSFTYMLSMISAYHEIEAVFIAIGITLFVTIGVTLLTMQTRFYFDNWYLLAVFLVLALCGLGIGCGIAAAVNNAYILQAVYGGIGATLMAVFLAIDTQLLMGNRSIAFNPEEYVNAALQIYLDICVMFLYILQAVSGAKK